MLNSTLVLITFGDQKNPEVNRRNPDPQSSGMEGTVSREEQPLSGSPPQVV